MSGLPSRTIATPLLLLALVAACGPGEDTRVADLTVGISKDSAITSMGGERPSRIDPYLTGGQYIEAMLYNPAGSAPTATDTILDRERTPLVVINGLLAGWGWSYWDSVATANKIPVAPPR